MCFGDTVRRNVMTKAKEERLKKIEYAIDDVILAVGFDRLEPADKSAVAKVCYWSLMHSGLSADDAQVTLARILSREVTTVRNYVYREPERSKRGRRSPRWDDGKASAEVW